MRLCSFRAIPLPLSRTVIVAPRGDTPAETVWAFIDHVTVAQLNDTFDVDRAAAQASLDPAYLEEAFPDRFGAEESAP